MPITDLSPTPASETDPYPQYLSQAEGDARYRQNGVTQISNGNVKSIGLSIGNLGAPSSTSNQCGLEAQAANSFSAAFFSLHRPGIYGVHLGLDSNNLLSVGGWSLGTASYRVFHEGVAPLFKAPLPTALQGQNSFSLSWNSVSVGQGIAELCCYPGNGGGDAFNFYRVFGNGDAFPTLANRISRIDAYGAYLQTSDERLKTDFTEAPGLEVLLNLVPKRYKHWNCMGFDEKNSKIRLGKNCYKKIGFIAQKVRSFLPEAVPETASEQELYSIDYNVIVACTVRAVQQLHEQILDLQQQISQLQTQISNDKTVT